MKHKVSLSSSMSTEMLDRAVSNLIELGAVSAQVTVVGDHEAIVSAMSRLGGRMKVVSAVLSLRGDKPAK